MVEPISTNLQSGQSQAFFHAVSHCCPVSLFTTDLDGCCTYLNPQFQSFYGGSGEGNLGQDWIQWVHPRQQQTILAQWKTQLQETSRFSGECCFQTQHGKMLWGYVRSTPLRDEQGGQMGYIFTVEEICNLIASRDSFKGSEAQLRLTLAEAALQESEQRFRALADHLPLQIWMGDCYGSGCFANAPYLQFTGFSLEEISQGWLDLLHPEDKAAYLNNYYTAIANRTEHRAIVRLRRHDGVYRWFDIIGLPRFEGERFIGYVGCSIDITEQKETEVALRQSQARLKLINERFQFAATAINALIYDWDIAQDYVERTEGLTHILGYSVAEAEPTGNWWRTRVHPEDLQRMNNEATTTLATSDYYTGEYRVLNKQNEYVYVLDQGLVVTRDAQGHPLRIVGSTSNISDRKRAEIALREREQRFSTLFNGMQDWVLVYHLMPDNQPGNLIEVNEQACQKLGYTRDELLNLSIVDLVATSSGTHADLEKLLQNKHVVTESIHVTTDGRQLPVEVSATLFTLNGLPTVQLICRDISERKTAEEALRNSERLYRAIGETLDYGIWVCDAEGRNTYASESFLKLVGITQEQCSEFGWGDVLHPEDIERTIAAWKECVKTEGNWDIEHRFRGVDGQWHPVLARGVPVKDKNGKVLCWAGINLDISRQKQTEAALRQSEEQFRQLADAMPQIVWATNAAGELEYVNQQWCSYSGLTLEEGRQRQYVHPAIHPDDLESAEAQWRICVKTGLPYQKECRLRRGADGSYRWFLIRAVAIANSQGQVVRWYGTSTDIDERKRSEAERELLLKREQVARQEAEAANRIKDEFLAVLSHELRSPLNPILGWASLLRSRKLNPSATERALETIERNAKLQTQLIEDLLDVSRILRGKMVLKVSSVNLVSVIEAALETVCLAAAAKKIEIKTSFNLSVAIVSGDTSRLQQVIWNLCSNAVKFTPQGGQVEIRLQQVGTMAEIQVEDTGIGISATFIPHVFEYFRQEDGSTTRKFGGLGLGLAIARHLTELHGGIITVESPGEEQGSIFTVRLPLIINPQPLGSQTQLPLHSSNLSHVKILAVDDQAEMRELLVTLLEESQAQVRVAASAVEALAILQHFKPNVLVSDIGMPDVDGYMLLQQIRKLPPEEGGEIPAIALTAYAGEANQKQAQASGYQVHLPKPIEPAQLIAAIASLIV